MTTAEMKALPIGTRVQRLSDCKVYFIWQHESLGWDICHIKRIRKNGTMGTKAVGVYADEIELEAFNE